MDTLDPLLAGDPEPWLDAVPPDARAALERLLAARRDPEAAAAVWLADLLEPDRAGQPRDELEAETRSLVADLRAELVRRLCAGSHAGERARLAYSASGAAAGAAAVIVAEHGAELAAHVGIPVMVATPIAALLLARAAVVGRRALCGRARPVSGGPPEPYEFDVALSYATEERRYVRRVADVLQEDGVAVFLDQFATVALWGANLLEYFHDVYRRRSRSVVVFTSASYAARAWPMFELRAALEAAVLDRRDCVLPARLDDTSVPWLPRTIGSVDCRNRTPEALASILVQRVRASPRSGPPAAPGSSSGS